MTAKEVSKKRCGWAFQPYMPPNKTPLRVTERDLASIEAAVAAGKVRRVGFDGREIR